MTTWTARRSTSQRWWIAGWIALVVLAISAVGDAHAQSAKPAKQAAAGETPAAETPAAETPDAPLPDVTKEAVAAAIDKSLPNYKRGYIEVIFRELRGADQVPDGETPALSDTNGRYTYGSDGRRWRGEYHGHLVNRKTWQATPRSWIAGFDGLNHYVSQGDREFVVGRQVAHENIPTEIKFWSSHGLTMASNLRGQSWQFLPTTVVDGYRCYVLVQDSEARGHRYRYHLTVSPWQSYLPVRYQVEVDGNLIWSHELHRLKQDEVGVWYPQRIVRVDTYSKRRVDFRVRHYKSNRPWDDDFFQLPIPWGVQVRDNREGRIYLNDPWWPEVKAYMRRKHDWPPVDLTPLRDVGSLADEAIEGKPAPPIQAARWLQGEPVDLKKRKQPVTLLHFWTGSVWQPNPQQVAALREFHRVYAPHGLQVVDILTDDSDTEETLANLKQLRVTWPVALDTTSKQAGSYGPTFQAYRLKAYTGWLLVDHQGLVHLVNDGNLADQVKKLLEQAGRKDVPTVSLGFVREPNGMSLDVYREWQAWLPQADHNGRLIATVTRGDQPQAGLQVTAQLRLEISGSAHTTSATTILPYRKQQWTAVTDDQGRFELNGLYKGTYELSFSGNGKKFTRKTSLPASDSQLTDKFSAP